MVTPASLQAQAAVEARRTAVRHWEEVRSTYRYHLDTLSLSLHPFTLRDSAPQTSEQVYTQSDTPGKAGGLMSGAASKAVGP
jgi:hypothetical protein